MKDSVCAYQVRVLNDNGEVLMFSPYYHVAPWDDLESAVDEAEYSAFGLRSILGIQAEVQVAIVRVRRPIQKGRSKPKRAAGRNTR